MTGGRGGDVYIVTNLQNSVTKPPEGSLRRALNKQSPKTIVFAARAYTMLEEYINSIR